VIDIACALSMPELTTHTVFTNAKVNEAKALTVLGHSEVKLI
jgi:hypothetical protein